ncbi:hypothetical protein IWW34DRAFT_707315 [Fusarium oxysporum f. sp. albedinis]|nr:hypothetical protein IWW34DRAFT_707315 [Fusarium oxysporum f. sp. albedinis]KAJ0135626.1 Uncharacterized protein HZ326_21362 [Fusarium oxysporum f. sp. albedinis]KAK2469712.1 hypothetical protein H9L39_18527 [Fusarium oxysporum f. sp. albedinis]
MPALPSFVLEEVKIFTGHEFIEKGFVIIQDGLINEVGRGQFTRSDLEGITRISRPGSTLIPGLFDAHIHAMSGNINSMEQSLRFGCTTVCDLHNDPADNARLMKLASEQANKSKYADFKCCGLGAVFENGWPKQVIKKVLEDHPQVDEIVDHVVSTWPKIREPEDAEPFVRQQVEEHGASYIKVFHELGDTLGIDLVSPRHEVVKAVVDAAHKHGVIAVGHALSQAGAMALLDAGIDGLAHIFLDESSSDFITRMASQQVHCNPTLVLCASHTTENREIRQQFLADPFAKKMMMEEPIDKPLGFAEHQRPKASVQHAYRTVRSLYQAGVPILAGTDASGQGFDIPFGLGVHLELYLLAHEVGMTPEDVLKTATSIPADRFGFNDRGRIEAGRKADLVLLEGDAASFLSDRYQRCLPITGVWRDGELTTVFSDGFPELR